MAQLPELRFSQYFLSYFSDALCSSNVHLPSDCLVIYDTAVKYFDRSGENLINMYCQLVQLDRLVTTAFQLSSNCCGSVIIS